MSAGALRPQRSRWRRCSRRCMERRDRRSGGFKSLLNPFLVAGAALALLGCEAGLVEPFGVPEGGIVYGLVTDALGRPARHVPVAMRSGWAVFQGTDTTAANPGTATLGAQPAFGIQSWAKDYTDQTGRFEMLARGVLVFDADGNRRTDMGTGTWELGCGPYHDPAFGPDAEVLLVRDTVVLEPYAVVRRDIQCGP